MFLDRAPITIDHSPALTEEVNMGKHKNEMKKIHHKAKTKKKEKMRAAKAKKGSKKGA